MGRLINVVLPGGKVVSVDEDVARAIRGDEVAHVESQAEGAARSTADINRERSSGFAEGAKAAVEGFVDSATLGGYGALRGLDSAEDSDFTRDAQIRAQERRGSRLAGELAAVLLPTGLAGKGAAAVGGALPINLLANAARQGGGRLAEGAVYGLAGAVAASNVSGDQLSVEGLVKDAGVGAILNYGIGKLADGVGHVGARAAARVEERAKISSFLDKSPTTYKEFRDTYRATVEAARNSRAAYDKVAKDYNEIAADLITKPEGISKLINSVDSQERAFLKRLTNQGLAPEAKLAITEAKDALAKARLTAGRAIKEGNHVAALEALEDGVVAAKKSVPNAAYPEMPVSPRGLGPRPVVPDVDYLPDTLREFSRMTPERIAKLANDVKPGTAAAEAFDKLATDIGLTVSESSAATIAGVHSKLHSLAGVASKDEATAATGLLDLLRKTSKRAVRYGMGREADTLIGGGFAGATSRVVVGAGVGYALDGIEGAVIGASLLNSKAAARNRVEQLFARYGKAGTKIAKLGPVSSYLKSSILGDGEDSGTDIRQLALNRINELQSLQSVVNDASYTALQPLMAEPEDLAFKLHSLITNAIGFATATAPSDPGLATSMATSYWKPTHSEALRVAHTLEAVLAPDRALERLISGQSDPSAADAMWAMWPGHMQEAAEALAANIDQYSNLTREQTSSLSRIFRIPLNGFQEPEVLAQLQSLYLPKPSSPNGSAPPNSGGGAGGRPPKVQGPDKSLSRVQQLQG